jgi:hypothetical protein
MALNEDLHTTTGILEAIAGLRQTGRPISADKMECSFDRYVA